MCGCQGNFNGCPAAGYPQPPAMACGCGGGNPGPFYPPGPPPQAPYFPDPDAPRMGGLGGFGRTIGALEDAAAGLGASLVGDLGTLDPSGKICKKWNDGVYHVTQCCTPSVGRYGVKVQACIVVKRPVDPWGQQAQPGKQGFPQPTPM